MRCKVGVQSIHDPLAEAVAAAKGQLTVDLKEAVNTLLYDNDYVLRTEYVSELLTYVQVVILCVRVCVCA